MLSNGEFVVSASQARKHMGLLHALNNGNISCMATGGVVSSDSASRRVGSLMTVTYAPQVSIGAGAPAESVTELRRALEDDRRQFASRTIKTIQGARLRSGNI